MPSSAQTRHRAQILSLSTWRSLLSTLEGRDKLLRLLQYLFKLLRGATSSARFTTFETTLSLSRQTSRLLKWLHHTTPPPSKPILQTAGETALAAYYLADNWALLCKTGVLKHDAGKATRRAGSLWLVAVICFLFGAVRTVASRKTHEEENGNGDRVKVVRYAADVVVAWSLVRRKPVSPVVVGLCGGVSSCAGLWQNWPASV